MNNDVKVIAHYLPQFHETEENNRFWGKGYTDWVAVKGAKTIIEGQIQPRIPENEHYYSLDDVDEIKKQAEMAKKYGVYGFGIYHYWFNSDMCLLDTPCKLLLQDKSIDINFLFNWDNSSWKRTWSAVHYAADWAPMYENSEQQDENDNGIMAQLIYGNEEDWKKHFDYLLPYFKDERYIKIDGKPVFNIFQPNNDYNTIKKMVDYWKKLAIENGFPGLIVGSKVNYMNENLDYNFYYEPFSPNTFTEKVISVIKNRMRRNNGKPTVKDYDKYWHKILKRAEKNKDKRTIYGGIVDFDDSPRRGEKCRVLLNATPEKFGKYMEKLMKISQRQNKDIVYLTAWNEWGEGAYLEPDTRFGYEYLEQLKKAIDSVNHN